MNVPDLTLERFRLGELPAAQSGRVQAALAADAALRARLSGLEASPDQVWLRGLAGGVRSRLAAAPADARGWLWPAVPAVLAIVVVVLVVRPFESPAPTSERIKGPDATLAIYRQTPSGSEQLDDRSVAREGDVIRIGYRLNDDGFGAIVSVDGRGTVTVHYPDGAPTAAPMNGGHSVLLSHAYELDDAPKWERFYIITGPQPFPIDAIVSAARRAGGNAAAAPARATLELAPGMTQATFLLQKDSRP